mgnify:CR=1 FL=1
MKQKTTVELIGKSIGKLKSAESVVNKIGSSFDYVNSILPAGIGEFLGLSEASMNMTCLLYTSPSPRDRTRSRMPSSA